MRIVLPLSMPITVVMTLYYGSHTGTPIQCLNLHPHRSLYPLQVFLREILTLGSFMSEITDSGSYSAEELPTLPNRQKPPT
jgi:hypothetical protein